MSGMVTLEEQLARVQAKIDRQEKEIECVKQLAAYHPERQPELDRQLTELHRQLTELHRRLATLEEEKLLLMKRGAAQQLAAPAEQLVQLFERMELQSDFQKKVLEYVSDTSSHTIDASEVTASDVDAIDAAMKADRRVDGDVDLAADALRYSWLKNEREDSTRQKASVMAFLEDKLLTSQQLRDTFTVMDINQSGSTDFPKASFSRLHRSFRDRADYLVVPAFLRDCPDVSTLRNYALIGFEFKKQLEAQHRAQARLGHWIYGSRAKTALLYVLSDLVTGGIVFWAQRLNDGSGYRLQVIERGLAGMQNLLRFLQQALSSTPNGAWGRGSDSRPIPRVLHLSEPERDQFTIEDYQYPQLGQARHVQVMCWDSDDEQDLCGFKQCEDLEQLCAVSQPPFSM